MEPINRPKNSFEPTQSPHLDAKRGALTAAATVLSESITRVVKNAVTPGLRTSVPQVHVQKPRYELSEFIELTLFHPLHHCLAHKSPAAHVMQLLDAPDIQSIQNAIFSCAFAQLDIAQCVAADAKISETSPSIAITPGSILDNHLETLAREAEKETNLRSTIEETELQKKTVWEGSNESRIAEGSTGKGDAPTEEPHEPEEDIEEEYKVDVTNLNSFYLR